MDVRVTPNYEFKGASIDLKRYGITKPHLALVGAARGRLRVHGDRRHEGRPPGRGAQYAVVLLLLLPSRVGLRGARGGRVVVEPVSEVGRGRRRAVV